MKKALRVMAKDDIPVSENSQKVDLYCSSKVKLQDNKSLKKYWKIDHNYINRKNKVKYSEKQYKKMTKELQGMIIKKFESYDLSVISIKPLIVLEK